MSFLFPRASLKRSPRTRTRKGTTSEDKDTCSTLLSRRKTRPPPLQIIPELSEHELDPDASLTQSPTTARPSHFLSQQGELHSSCVTLSAYTFSIDDAFHMFGDDAPRSPALSASSSTSDGASSEDILVTPGTSDDEDSNKFALPTPRIRPHRVTVRPLCIVKTRSLICPEDKDIHDYFNDEQENGCPFPVTEQSCVATELLQEADYDFYTREFENFISLSPIVSSPIFPARRDSLTLTAEAPFEVPEQKPCGRSRHSKPLPLLPPVTPPISLFPPTLDFSLVQTTARNSVVRRKRNVPPFSSYPLLPPAESRPLPRMTIPVDIEDCIFSDEDLSAPPAAIRQDHNAGDDASIYSRSSFPYSTFVSFHPLSPAITETPLSEMYGEVMLPRSSIDSTCFTPTSPSSFPRSVSSEGHEPELTQRLCSRWSSSTLASLAVDPPRSTTILSPLRNVFGSRGRRVPPQKAPPQIPPYITPPRLCKNKQGISTNSPSPPGRKHDRQQGSRSSTSSDGTSSSKCDSRDVSPSGLKRKPIPITMFLRI